MNNDIQKLESLLAEKKLDEAREVIKSIISAKMSDEEKGDILIGLSSAYLDIMNSINESYRDALDEAINGLETVNSADSRMTDIIRVAEIKESLGK